ncbi:MAG TPA: transglycosylase SLT domain-containing protein [Candidatus Binatia bacterium]|nr:transglycosylase SLT domain-containing protein [Candidatus Binatia bacterium]
MNPGTISSGKAAACLRMRAVLSAALAIAALSTFQTSPSALAASDDFPRPAKLAPAIEFWKRIFATYSEHQVVVHDDWYLGKVYEVIDFRPWYADGEPETAELAILRRAKIDETKERVRATLLRLHALGPDPDPSQLSDEERKVAALFRDVRDPDKYLAATERIRTQSGLRERFGRGIAQQERYLDRMESILVRHGLPRELARLPLVESCFDIDAYSKVGAAGVWQFMPDTGRQYMRVSGDVDERRDPIRATDAAAEHLSNDYEALGTWPLAITAYNHGRGGVAKGVRETGTTDIGELATRYRGKAFGFASRNFYAEFVAAVEVARDADEHFGDLPKVPPMNAVEIELERPIHLAAAARRIGCDTDDLALLNPALMSPITRGRAMVPRGYVLRVPASAGSSSHQVAIALAGVEPDETQLASARPMVRSARVVRIASSRSSSGSARKAAARGVRVTTVASRSNGKGSSGKATVVASAKQPAQAPVVHKVTAGQTLADIARRYGTTVALLQGVNNLHRSRTLQPGQRLRIPRGDT